MRYLDTAAGTTTRLAGYIAMESLLTSIFGIKDHVSLPQECARAALIFAYGLLLLRLSGRRTFGHWSALDIVISVIMGSALSKAMVGSAPLPGTMAAAAVLVALHVGVAHLVARSRRASHLIEGTPVTLIDHGRVDEVQCQAHMISRADLDEALRQNGIDCDVALDNVKLARLEPSGEITVIKRGPCKPDPT